jgi:glycine/D-amino acid oxidase-like deaminating enzyme
MQSKGLPPGRVLVVGAGLASSLLAVYLARAGWKVALVERRGDPRAQRLQAARASRRRSSGTRSAWAAG